MKCERCEGTGLYCEKHPSKKFYHNVIKGWIWPWLEIEGCAGPGCECTCSAGSGDINIFKKG